MTSITKIFNSNSFTSFEEVKTFFESEPYFFEVKETNKMFMLCMSERSDLSMKVVREATGVIFEKNTNKLIHYSFAKAYEGFSNEDIPVSFEKDYLYNGKIEESDQIIIDHYIEGSIIKLYFYNDKWNVGTSRHIDGNQNRWSSKSSFEKLFNECVMKSYNCSFKEFKESLDTNYAYTFLFQHPDHNMTIPVATALCFPLNRVNLITLEEENEEKGNLTTKYKSISEIDIQKNELTQNYIVYHLDSQGKIKNRIKMLSNKFLELKEKIGNFPNLGLVYLRNLKNTEDKMLIRSKYLQHSALFSTIDRSFYKSCKQIHDYYIKTHVKKENSVVPMNYRQTVRQMHGQYRQTKEPIQLQDVIDKIITLSPRTLAYIINYIY